MPRQLFKNRYGDTMSFEWTKDRNILWRGSKSSYSRMSMDEDNNLTMIDPPGGPYMAVGDVIDFPKDFEGYTIKGFQSHEEGYIIVV